MKLKRLSAILLVFVILLSNIQLASADSIGDLRQKAASVYENLISLNPNDLLYHSDYVKQTYQCTEEQANYIKNTALEITKNAETKADKISAVCKYLAETIYYDYDYINERASTLYVYPQDVLTKGYTICAGYAYTAEALLQSIDIPCVFISTAFISSTNHAYNAAYDGERWILFDATWCSNNRYEGGQKKYNAPRYDIWYDFTIDLASSDNSHIIHTMSYTQYFGELRSVPQGMRRLQLPDTVTSFNIFAFTWVYDFALYGKKDSLAYGYAAENGIPFIVTDQTRIDEKSTQPYINGYEDSSFNPEGLIKRAEVAKVIARLLTEKFDFTAEYSTSFSDIASDDWYKNDIGFIESFQFITGYTDKTFRPEDYMTRAEASTALTKAMGMSPIADDIETFGAKFDDIDDHWAEGYIKAMSAAGVINGYDDGTFKPENKITRAEFAVMISRILTEQRLAGLAESRPSDMTESHWAYDAVLKAMNIRTGR